MSWPETAIWGVSFHNESDKRLPTRTWGLSLDVRYIFATDMLWRLASSGNSSEGFIFRNLRENPLNLDALVGEVIQPAL